MLSTQLPAIAHKCQHSPVGKLLPNALYVHLCALEALDIELQDYEERARITVPEAKEATLVKFYLEQPKISYLFYPEFDTNPHPCLQVSIQVNLTTEQVNYRDYRDSNNPPILHRKETFVTREYPLYEEFAELTRQEEALGLLGNSRFIGTLQGWSKRLRHHRLEIKSHRLACPFNARQEVAIARHKAAIPRTQISRPTQLALLTEILTPDRTFFDYGCGHGGDVERLKKKGYTCGGWDPFYFPEEPKIEADVVNLGYIINVIEDTAERREALIQAWKLTGQVLIVSAQVLIDDPNRGVVVYGDGIVTSRRTFQKYYEQEELKSYIDQVLQVDSIPVGLGIYFVFRDATVAETFRASRFHSNATTPTIRIKVRKFEDYEQLLTPLMQFVTLRGRLPVQGELPEEEEIRAEFGTFRRAFQLVLQATGEKEWDAIAEKRRQDFQVYLALSQFNRRPRMRDFSIPVKEDIKALFGSYKKACLLADMMLFSLRDLQNISDLCFESNVGRKTASYFLIHISVLETLDPLLRLYEGCASRTIGRLENANVIKLHLRQPKISYLSYTNFDTEPHPCLHTSMQVDLQDLHVSYWEYDAFNPPILHRKDNLVSAQYPLHDKFAKLTQQEKSWGLLENLAEVSRRQQWLQCLENHCAMLSGHQVRWRKDSDPDKVREQKALMRKLRKLQSD